MLEDHYFDKDIFFNTFDFLRAMLVNNRVKKKECAYIRYVYWNKSSM